MVEGLKVMVGSSWVVIGCVALVGVTSVVVLGMVVFGDGCVTVGVKIEVV